MQNKKKLLIILALLILTGSAFVLWKKNYKITPKETASTENSGPAISTRSEAENIAKDFLSKQNYKNDYKLDPVSVEVYPEFWNVWFATVDQNKKPNRGLVQIDTKTGAPVWKELQ